MALAHDPSTIASAVLIAAGDMLFLPAEDSIPVSSGMDRARAGHALVFVADDGVDGVALWTSDGTHVGTRRIAPIRPADDHDTHGRPGTADVSPAAQESASSNGQAGGKVNGQRMLSSILDDWRDAERRLEDARQAGDAAEVTRLGVEVSSFADEHRQAFESLLAQYADEETMTHARRRVTWSTPKGS